VVCNRDPAYSQTMAFPASPVDDGPRGPALKEPEQLVVESCGIALWRGYVSSAFVALLADGTVVAESADFRSRGKAEPPDDGAARQAYDELRADLDRLGWTDAKAQSQVWYAGLFTRLVAVEPASVPVAPAAPEVEAAPIVEPQRRILYEAPMAPPRIAPQVGPEPRTLAETPMVPPAPPRIAPPVEPEPRTFVEAPMPTLPPVGQTAVETPGRSRAVTIVSVFGITVALGLGAYLALGQGRSRVVYVKIAPVSAAKPKPAVAPASVVPATPAQPASHANVRVAISTNGRASWLEVRRGSATGPVLFSGELAPDKTIHLSGSRLWGRFGAAGNLTITANGRPVRLLGTYEHVFTAAKP
jgi:hypothetical protein